MRFKVFILTLFLTVLAVAAPQARRAAKLEHIKFGKCRIVSMTPKGLRSVRAEVELEAKNDTAAFVLEDVKLLIFRKGEPFVEGFCGEIKVPRGSSKVHASGDFELCDDVSVIEALKVLNNPDMSEFSGNVDMTVVNAKGRRIAYSQQGLSMGSGGAKPKTVQPKTEPAQKEVQADRKEVKEPSKKPKKRPWWQFWKR